jgi:hypothetical protein
VIKMGENPYFGKAAGRLLREPPSESPAQARPEPPGRPDAYGPHHPKLELVAGEFG